MTNFNSNQAADIINHTIPSVPFVVVLSLIINVCVDRNQISDVDKAIGRLNMLRQDISPATPDLIDVCKLLLESTEVGLVLDENQIFEQIQNKFEAVDRWMRTIYPPITLPE